MLRPFLLPCTCVTPLNTQSKSKQRGGLDVTKIHIKQLNNLGAAAGSVVLNDGTRTRWSAEVNGAMRLPGGTAEERPEGIGGLLRFNAETDRLEAFFGGVWQTLVGSNSETGGSFVDTSGDTMSGTLAMQAGAVLAASDGTDTLPGLSFANDLDTGMYRVSANRIGFTTGGQRILTLANAAGAVNHLEIRNSPTGTGPRISIIGADSNADIILSPKGTGVVSVAESTGYEDLVLDDNDIPNKKYVDDTVALATAHGPNLNALADTETVGLYVVTNEGISATRSITGTANQIAVQNGSGVAGDISLTLANNPVLPGSGAVLVPTGTTAQRPAPAVNGSIRYNSQTSDFEFYKRDGWTTLYDVTNLTTGLKLGGAMYVSDLVSIPGGPTFYTTFSIGAGEGVIVDGHTNPHQPVATLVKWDEILSITPTGLGQRNVTFVLIDKDGTVIQQATDPTSAQLRDYIYLGFVLHLFGVVQLTNNQPNIAVEPGGQFLDLMNGLGIFNKIGNLITPAATSPMRLSKTAGTVFKSGISYQSNRSNPHEAFVPAMPECLLNYVTISGASIPNVFDLDPTLMVVGGTFAPVPGDGHVATVQRLYLYPMGLFIAFPGQKVYDSLGEAIEGQATEPFEIDPYAQSNGVLLALIAMTKDCTDIKDPKKARIIYPDRFGTILTNSAAIPDFQDIYNTSVNASITVDALRGPFDIRDAGTPLGVDLLTILAGDGTPAAGFGIDASTFRHDVVLTDEGRLTLVDGTAASPALRFSGDSDSGLRLAAVDTVSLVANGQDGLTVTGTPAGVNRLDVATGTTGQPVVVSAQGSDTNVSVVLRPKGTGVLSVSGTLNYETRLTDADDIPNKRYVDDLIDSVLTTEDLVSQTGEMILNGVSVTNGVNHVVARNALTGETPELSAGGPADDLDLIVTPKGDGYVRAGDGYDMTGGPATAYATKAYVDTRSLPEGMVVEQITGADASLSEPLVFMPDAVRGKTLSMETNSFTVGRVTVAADSWLQLAGLSDETIGVVMPYAGTLVRATAVCSDAGGNAKNFSVYVDGTETTGVLTITGTGVQHATNATADIDFTAGAKIRIRARNGSGAALGNTSVTFSVKWRVEEII